MKIENKSARLVHLNIPGGMVAVPPLGSVELTGEQATAAKEILDGPWKPLVDDGSLVVDGKQPAPTLPTAGEPSPAAPPPHAESDRRPASGFGGTDPDVSPPSKRPSGR